MIIKANRNRTIETMTKEKACTTKYKKEFYKKLGRSVLKEATSKDRKVIKMYFVIIR